MKVKISNYPTRLTCRIHTRYMEKKYGYIDWPTEQSRFENFLEKVEDAIQSVYSLVNVPFLDKRTQKIKVHIDRWDTWSMDHTLAYIVLPMLKQLKKNTHGAPYVDEKDVPEELWPPKEQISAMYQGQTDDNHFKRWDWVLDEMIYAFDCKANKDEVYMRFDIKTEKDAMDKEQSRISNGFRLFGKYYEALWD